MTHNVKLNTFDAECVGALRWIAKKLKIKYTYDAKSNTATFEGYDSSVMRLRRILSELH